VASPCSRAGQSSRRMGGRIQSRDHSPRKTMAAAGSCATITSVLVRHFQRICHLGQHHTQMSIPSRRRLHIMRLAGDERKIRVGPLPPLAYRESADEQAPAANARPSHAVHRGASCAERRLRARGRAAATVRSTRKRWRPDVLRRRVPTRSGPPCGLVRPPTGRLGHRGPN